MKVSISQPAYLPWCGIFERIAMSDIHIALDHVPMSGGENKNKIRTANGVQTLTVPTNDNGAICDVTIANDKRWRKKHLSAIQQSYSHAPFYNQHKDFIEFVYGVEWTHLMPLNATLMDYMLQEFKIDRPIICSSDMSARGAKSQLVLNLCLEIGAKTYISGIFGRDYLDAAAFAAAGVAIEYHEYTTPPYKQCFDEFEANMSAVDALFNIGRLP